ncbi:hypothetical protein Tco_1440984, partial [Tanacetum coccineum]
YMPDGVLRETLKDVDDDNYLVIVVDEAHVIFELKHQVFKVVYTRLPKIRFTFSSEGDDDDDDDDKIQDPKK